jgi:hypothetical protein
MATSRLETISKELARMIAEAPFASQAEVTKVICTVAATETGLFEDADVKKALEAIGRTDPDAARLGSHLEAMASAFDDQCFRLYAEANERRTPAGKAMFRKARAASAIVCGMKRTTEEFAEAVYEAVHASGDDEKMIELATSLLGRKTHVRD